MSLFSSIVLTNPVVVGALAAGAACWAGFIARPDPARRRTRLLVAHAGAGRAGEARGALQRRLPLSRRRHDRVGG